MENIKKEIITSLEIAQLLKKQHSDVLRDLRDETNKLGEELSAKDFTLLIYKDTNKENIPLYKLTKEGALIFAERYEAHAKKTLVDKINDLTIDETISKTETVQDKVENEVKSEGNYETRRILYEIEKLDIKLQKMELNIKLLTLKKEKLLEKYKSVGKSDEEICAMRQEHNRIQEELENRRVNKMNELI